MFINYLLNLVLIYSGIQLKLDIKINFTKYSRKNCKTPLKISTINNFINTTLVCNFSVSVNSPIEITQALLSSSESY